MLAGAKYDAIVVGAGQGGGPLSTALARAGWKVALVEREHVGGTCINSGCTPTKTMVASARVAYLVGRAAEYGVNVSGAVSVDMAAVRERKRDIVKSFRQGSQRRIEDTDGLDLLFGEARFTGPKALTVRLNAGDDVEIRAEKIVLNTGSRPSRPPIKGLEDVPALDNVSVMELDTLPDHLLILGGGYIAVEFGQMFRRFGSRVTIVQRARQLLAREDDDVAEGVVNVLREDGIEVFLESSAQEVRAPAAEDVELRVRTQDGERTLRGSHLLVAAGRIPNSDRLNLSAADVEVDERGYIKVNERLETGAEGIYAIGDVKGGPAFTHISYDDYRVLRANLLDGGSASTTGRFVPYTVFIDPQLGRVGFTEREARAQGRNIRVAKMPMAHVARALEVNETRGFMKAVVDADTGQVLGAAVLGIEGGEVMGVLQMAMMGKVPYTRIRDGIFAHPTLTEALNNLFGTI